MLGAAPFSGAMIKWVMSPEKKKWKGKTKKLRQMNIKKNYKRKKSRFKDEGLRQGKKIIQ